MVPSEPHLASGGHDDSTFEFTAEHQVVAEAEGASSMPWPGCSPRIYGGLLERRPGGRWRWAAPLSIAALLLLARQITLLLGIP
jgi:hypothetical protein